MDASRFTLAERSGLPAPSAEIVLIRVVVASWIAVAHEKPRKRAKAFLDTATQTLATEESLALTLPIRPKADELEVAQARREAMAIWKSLLPVFVAKLPPCI